LTINNFLDQSLVFCIDYMFIFWILWNMWICEFHKIKMKLIGYLIFNDGFCIYVLNERIWNSNCIAILKGFGNITIFDIFLLQVFWIVVEVINKTISLWILIHHHKPSFKGVGKPNALFCHSYLALQMASINTNINHVTYIHNLSCIARY
jgi:hypothetical protein